MSQSPSAFLFVKPQKASECVHEVTRGVLEATQKRPREGSQAVGASRGLRRGLYGREGG